MKRFQRRAFLQQFMGGLVFLVTAYIILTIFREMRDNFAAEIWKTLGYAHNPAVFTLSEIPVAVLTLFSLALINLIRSNYSAFVTILFVVLAGFVTIIVSTTLYTAGILPGEIWMVGIGVGLYLGYIPFNAFLFERMIAAFRKVSNAGFLIYVADAFGYLGSLGVMFFKNVSDPGQSWITFFTRISLLFSLAGIALVIAALLFFRRKFLNTKKTTQYGYAFNTPESLLTLDARTVVHQ